ncbi:MAG: acyltransferase [Lachnospiraceae bacterium]|nr:acyltransferase [Lachnospiraceae bacterium]
MSDVSGKKTNTTSESERTAWIDGLKGIACLGVFICHLLISSFPAVINGDPAVKMLSGNAELRISNDPLLILVNGNFWVCIFFTVTGFLAAKAVFGAEDKPNFRQKIGTMTLKRYPRLMIPAFVAAFLHYFINSGAAKIFAQYIEKQDRYSFYGIFSHGFVFTWIYEDITLTGEYWTLHYLLFGFWIAILIAFMDSRKSRFIPVLYLILAFASIKINVKFMGFFFGVLLADLTEYGRLSKIIPEKYLKDKKFLAIAKCLLIVIGGYFGGYPLRDRGLIPPLFAPLKVLCDHLPAGGDMAIRSFGAFLIVGGLLVGGYAGTNKVLASKIPLFFGKICYSIYLVHMFLMEDFWAPILKPLVEKTGNYLAAAVISQIIMIAIVLGCAILMNITVERYSDKLCKKIKIQ